MRPTEQVENQLRKFDVATDAAKDKAVLESLLAAQSQSKKTALWTIVPKVGIIAVAAGIVLALLLWLPGTDGKKETASSGGGKTQSLPSELISVMSLNKAFYQGGMKAVDKQFEQAENRTISTSYESATREQLMCELSGDC